GGEFQVNTYTTNRQFYANVAADAAGNFVVVWTSRGSAGSDTDGYSVQGQRYDATGLPAGGEFQGNTYTTNAQTASAGAVDGAGNFVVTWTSIGSAGSDTDTTFPTAGSVQAQRYDASGAPLGSQFQVNTYTTGRQFGSTVAADAAGNFVILWTGYGVSQR